MGGVRKIVNGDAGGRLSYILALPNARPMIDHQSTTAMAINSASHSNGCTRRKGRISMSLAIRKRPIPLGNPHYGPAHL